VPKHNKGASMVFVTIAPLEENGYGYCNCRIGRHWFEMPLNSPGGSTLQRVAGMICCEPVPASLV